MGWDGQVHLVKGKTGGQQGDPLEMLIFNMTIYHLWGRVSAKFEEARAIAYADDGHIKAKLSIALQVLVELKAVFKADAGLEFNVSKTSILPMVSLPRLRLICRRPSCKQPQSLAHLRNDFLVDSFCPEGFIGIGVPIGTDAFVQSFVAKKCRDIIDDVEKLDDIQDGFIHFQLIRFFQATRLQYFDKHGV